jgi:hypothetical protein
LAGLLRTERLAESRTVVALLGLVEARLAVALVGLALLAGLLPVAFVVATSLLLGGLPDASRRARC